jgi:hypothetical protein
MKKDEEERGKGRLKEGQKEELKEEKVSKPQWPSKGHDLLKVREIGWLAELILEMVVSKNVPVESKGLQKRSEKVRVFFSHLETKQVTPKIW